MTEAVKTTQFVSDELSSQTTDAQNEITVRFFKVTVSKDVLGPKEPSRWSVQRIGATVYESG